MDNGWIKLHRNILDNGISKKPSYGWLWINLLLMANHNDKEFIFNNKKMICKRGQLLTGRKKLSEQTGIKEGTIQKILKYLEIEQQIEQQTTTKFRLITVKNYNKYQAIEQQKEQQRNNNVTTKEHKQECKNVRIKEESEKFKKPTIEELQIFMKENSLKDFSENFFNHYETIDWKVGKNKMKNWKSAVKGWASRTPELKNKIFTNFKTTL